MLEKSRLLKARGGGGEMGVEENEKTEVTKVTFSSGEREDIPEMWSVVW